MTLKYAFKLIFLKCIFKFMINTATLVSAPYIHTPLNPRKFMINTAPPTSNSVHGREKCFKYNNFSVSFIQWLRGAVVKDLTLIIRSSEEEILLNFAHYFFFSFLMFFSLWLFFLYFSCWSFKASQGFWDIVFLVLKWIRFCTTFWSLKKRVNSKSILISTAMQLVLKLFSRS